MHRSGGLDAYQHRVRKLRIKLPHLVAFVHQDQIHCFSAGRFQHSQRLLASMQITSYNSHSASFGPSAVRVNAETVYSGRCEAGLVMTSTVHMKFHFKWTRSRLTVQWELLPYCPSSDRNGLER